MQSPMSTAFHTFQNRHKHAPLLGTFVSCLISCMHCRLIRDDTSTVQQLQESLRTWRLTMMNTMTGQR